MSDQPSVDDSSPSSSHQIPRPDNAALRTADELLSILTSASKEAATLLQSISGNNGTISLLRKDIASRDTKITELSSIISERDHERTELQRKITDVQNVLHDKENSVSDLSERLKTAMQMDNISQNQELLTLKTNLQNGLKVEYSDYLASKDVECNPDSYGALLGSLARIFKTLRRFGIIID
jgi:chromosome segregation ATPase